MGVESNHALHEETLLTYHSAAPSFEIYFDYNLLIIFSEPSQNFHFKNSCSRGESKRKSVEQQAHSFPLRHYFAGVKGGIQFLMFYIRSIRPPARHSAASSRSPAATASSPGRHGQLSSRTKSPKKSAEAGLQNMPTGFKEQRFLHQTIPFKLLVQQRCHRLNSSFFLFNP